MVTLKINLVCQEILAKVVLLLFLYKRETWVILAYDLGRAKAWSMHIRRKSYPNRVEKI